MNIDPTSQLRVPVLVQLARSQDLRFNLPSSVASLLLSSKGNFKLGSRREFVTLKYLQRPSASDSDNRPDERDRWCPPRFFVPEACFVI